MSARPTASLPALLDQRELLRVLSAFRRGDFSVRMTADGGGIEARIAQTLNELIERNGHMARVLSAAAGGDLSQTVPLEVEGRPLKGEFLRAARAVNDLVGRLQAAEVASAERRWKPEEEIQALNRRLKRRLETVNQANRELEAFSYSVSHDLRGPLSRIAGFSRALLEFHAAQLDEEGQLFLKRIDHSANRMCQLVEELLNFSRLTRLEMNEQNLNLSAMVASLAAELRARDPERLVHFEIAPDVHGWGDATLVRAALENLLANSWKFTGKQATARIEFGQTETVRGLAYFVRDDGAGFDMQDAARLFSPFQRLHKESDFEGNGIGLATVERIIRRHGGHVWAEGEIDRGAIFYLTLPPDRPRAPSG
jgi:signal transduction histidine kinase